MMQGSKMPKLQNRKNAKPAKLQNRKTARSVVLNATEVSLSYNDAGL